MAVRFLWRKILVNPQNRRNHYRSITQTTKKPGPYAEKSLTRTLSLQSAIIAKVATRHWPICCFVPGQKQHMSRGKKKTTATAFPGGTLARLWFACRTSRAYFFRTRSSRVLARRNVDNENVSNAVRGQPLQPAEPHGVQCSTPHLSSDSIEITTADRQRNSGESPRAGIARWENLVLP